MIDDLNGEPDEDAVGELVYEGTKEWEAYKRWKHRKLPPDTQLNLFE